ncbi:MAG: DUF302 domain-containing protein [Eudoraea sp.]
MKYIVSVLILGSIVLFTSCGNNSKSKNTSSKQKNITNKVDEVVNQLQRSITSYKLVASLDHHRMAAEAGVYTPPSVATIFSDTKVDIALVQENQLAGLDMPFKILCYSEPDTLDVKVAYTSAEFIQQRHNLDPSLLQDYKLKTEKVLDIFPKEMISNTNLNSVHEGFGIISIKSDFDFPTTVSRLKETIMAQGDTKWFADVNYQKKASNMGVTIRPNILLLFGGPAPGGKAMMTSPKIGLDAFCQKLLVYEKANGEVWISYNDIISFAELYYNKSTKPQQMINQRLNMTFTKSVSMKTEE